MEKFLFRIKSSDVFAAVLQLQLQLLVLLFSSVAVTTATCLPDRRLWPWPYGQNLSRILAGLLIPQAAKTDTLKAIDSRFRLTNVVRLQSSARRRARSWAALLLVVSRLCMDAGMLLGTLQGCGHGV